MESYFDKLPLNANLNPLDALYEETSINEVLGLKELLELPVNDSYREKQKEVKEVRFKILDNEKNLSEANIINKYDEPEK